MAWNREEAAGVFGDWDMTGVGTVEEVIKLWER